MDRSASMVVDNGDSRALQLTVSFFNYNAGHRVPAGFSQERQVWVYGRCFDPEGAPVYQMGWLDANNGFNLMDKIVHLDPTTLGVASNKKGPDEDLVNFQNKFYHVDGGTGEREALRYDCDQL